MIAAITAECAEKSKSFELKVAGDVLKHADCDVLIVNTTN